MLGTDNFDLEEERPSYLDDIVGPVSSKIESDKIADKGMSEIQ